MVGHFSQWHMILKKYLLPEEDMYKIYSIVKCQIYHDNLTQWPYITAFVYHWEEQLWTTYSSKHYISDHEL